MLLPLNHQQNHQYIINQSHIPIPTNPSHFSLPTALVNNHYLQQTPILQQAPLRALTMNDGQSLSMQSKQYINQSQHMINPLQPPALAVPSYNPSNFVPMNRYSEPFL